DGAGPGCPGQASLIRTPDRDVPGTFAHPAVTAGAARPGEPASATSCLSFCCAALQMARTPVTRRPLLQRLPAARDATAEVARRGDIGGSEGQVQDDTGGCERSEAAADGRGDHRLKPDETHAASKAGARGTVRARGIACRPGRRETPGA